MPKVLIIEPDKALGETISKYLEDNGYKVIACQDAQQAILAADSSKPDLIVLELAMPKNNGLAFLQEFRSYTDWNKIPIIIYSQISREDTGISDIEWERQSIVAYLYKPTKTLASLLNAIDSAL